MAELGFKGYNCSSSLRSSLIRPRDASPDSVIFTPESNFSLFSSASASGDRCSFASDAHDHDSIVSEISLHLAGHDVAESSSGPDPDPDKHRELNSTRRSKKAEKKAKGCLKEKISTEREVEDGVHRLDSARSSFSLALKECQEKRSRSDAVHSKSERRRPVSLDLNNVATSSSPRLGAMKKCSASSRRSGAFPSPGTPNYRQNSVGIQKGWCSERVPAQGHANRRHPTAAGLLPFNNGRTLPSKWEDAERWIFSPMSVDGGFRPALQQPQRRPKSKSGPLGPPGAVGCCSLYSPVVPMFDGGNGVNYMANSPFSAGVMAADGVTVAYGGGHGRAFPVHTEPCMGRSASVHGCTEMLTPPFSGTQDEKIENVKDAATSISRAVSRRDMATQMSPGGSTDSSPKRRLSFSLSAPSIIPVTESTQFSRSEVRDVQVDERVTVTRWSKKHRGLIHGKSSACVDDWNKRAMGAHSSAWELSEPGKSITRVKRQEAKITAWENLQKAKAEAAIRKLEMKLEKKRSSSMDKILNKLRSAQKRAQDMRTASSENQADQVAKRSSRTVSFRRTRHMGSLSGCFTCHAF